MKMNKKAYMAPMVEIMNARVEKGFQVSGTNPDERLSELERIEGSTTGNAIVLD